MKLPTFLACLLLAVAGSLAAAPAKAPPLPSD
jgi:hypothetical protein